MLCVENGLCPFCDRPKKRMWEHMQRCYAKKQDNSGEKDDDDQTESEAEESECEGGQKGSVAPDIEESKDVLADLLKVESGIAPP